MKKFKIFYYLYYEFNNKGRFITDSVIIEAWGKEQAIRIFKDLGIEFSDFSIEEIDVINLI